RLIRSARRARPGLRDRVRCIRRIRIRRAPSGCRGRILCRCRSWRPCSEAGFYAFGPRGLVTRSHPGAAAERIFSAMLFLDDADGAVVLEDGGMAIADVGASRLAQRRFKLVMSELGLAHDILEKPAIVDEDLRA